MIRFTKRHVPNDGFERVVQEAINSGKLQNYIFDNYKLFNQDMLRRFTATILNMKPAKRLMQQNRCNQHSSKQYMKAVQDSEKL